MNTDPSPTLAAQPAEGVRIDSATCGFVVFDDAEELDIVGPWEVLTASAMLRAASSDDVAADRCVTVGPAADAVVTCNKGLRLRCDHAFGDHPRLDVIVVPGGQGTRAMAGDDAFLTWLAGVAATARWVTSVCTGSLLLVASGIARGRSVATHWRYEDAMADRGDCTVVRDRRWVVDGNVVTSQGVSAGIDMALWLAGTMHGAEHARDVAREIQYDPDPPAW